MLLKKMDTRKVEMDRKKIFILYSSIIMVALLHYVDAVLQIPYFWKSVVKILALAMVFGLYSYRFKDNFIKESIANYRLRQGNKLVDKKRRLHLLLGVLAFFAILLVYWLAAPYMNLGNIVASLQEKYGIAREQLLYYGLYLAFGNALLEEMLFRGYVFLGLLKRMNRWYAYLFSSILFSIYHISVINTWFNPLLFLVALLGLMLSGFLFCYLDEKNQTFLNSYFVHVCADLAIVLIGYHIMS